MIDRFVCVRLVKANDLDLTLFQFDYDLTFAVFFMNADKTIYGRFGSRSSRDDAQSQMTMAGLAESMSAALKLHQNYPDNKAYLTGKQAAVTKYKSPDDYPSLRGKFKSTLDYKGEVTKSCMHCHQIRDAEREVYRNAGQPIPDPLLFPDPLPDVVGFSLDPRTRATISEVAENSAAAGAGLQVGDELLTLDGQAIVSLADVQWVLNGAPSSGTLSAVVKRGGQLLPLSLTLNEGWRRASDLDWRVSTWPLRRMVTGGLVLESASDQQRREAGAAEDELALWVKGVGQYGPHAAAKQAGFQKDDVIVSFNGRTDNMTNSQLLAYAAQNTKPGQKIPVTVVRGGKRIELKMPMQQ